MGALQKLISQIMERLRDMTLSQRVALFLGGALVAVSLIWLVQWAARPEMVPLLDQDFTRGGRDPGGAGLAGGDIRGQGRAGVH
jgi:flagellar biosynthesis/type III secretory pathway M-ring protein FliF/YscJ